MFEHWSGSDVTERRYAHSRAEWFSTVCSFRQPRVALQTASTSTDALGRAELGHMYRRMKSSALHMHQRRYLGEVRDDGLLVFTIPMFGESA